MTSTDDYFWKKLQKSIIALLVLVLNLSALAKVMLLVPNILNQPLTILDIRALHDSAYASSQVFGLVVNLVLISLLYAFQLAPLAALYYNTEDDKLNIIFTVITIILDIAILLFLHPSYIPKGVGLVFALLVYIALGGMEAGVVGEIIRGDE